LVTKLIATIDGVQRMEKDYAFRMSTLAEYGAKMAADPNGKWAITLTARGFDKVQGTDIRMTSTPQFISSTEVVTVPSVDATVTYVHHPLGYKEEAGIW